jgi:Chitinase
MQLIAFLLTLIFILPMSELTTANAATIHLNSTSFTLTINNYKTLYVIGTSRKVTWSSSNRAVATVSTGGKVVAKAPGTAYIYAYVAGKKLSSKVTVIKLSASSASLAVGTTKTLSVKGTTRTVTWSTSNRTIATVSSVGKVTAKTPGTVKIYASVLGKKLTCTITVLKLNPTSTTSKTTVNVFAIQPAKRIIGYYAAWSRYSGFTPDKIDASKLTHINYAFANIGSDLKISLGYPDIDPSNINGLNQLKQINPNLKTIISVGGYSWSGKFSDVALTDASRATFANSCVDFVVKYGFDGIDIDWEYPVAGGLSTNVRRPEDKYNYTLLMKTLREKLDARGAVDGKKYLLSFAGAAGNWYIKNIEPIQMIQYVDYVNVMSYDLHGPWETLTNYNSPLYSYDPLHPSYISASNSINAWINSGFPKSKIVMGVPFYGYIYKAVANINNGFNQTYSGASSISYKNIAANYLNALGYNKFYDTNAKVPWLFNGSTFISYENEQSMAEKANYIKTNGLSGVMIWELSQDQNNILLNSLYQQLIQ